jgi:microcystin-dependent protein
MHRVDNATSTPSIPTPAAVGPNPDSFFTSGNPSTATEATTLDDDWLNSVQEELSYVIEQQSVTLDKTARNQLKKAIDYMLLKGASAYASAGGTANALTATLSPVPAAYYEGMEVKIKIAATNTAAATLNLNSLGVVAIKQKDLNALRPGQLRIGMVAKLIHDGTYFQLQNPDTAAGTSEAFRGSTIPDGWLAEDGSAISRTTYAALYAVLGTTWGVGDGATTFNLPDTRGRSILGAGTYTKNEIFATTAVNTGTETITVASNNTYYTGQAVVYNNGGGASITGLTSTTTYYVIRTSSTAIQLATTLANALAGTAIDLSGTGNNAQYLTFTLTARTLADLGGEESHALKIAEIPAHSHYLVVSNGGGASQVIQSQNSQLAEYVGNTTTGNQVIQDTGGSTAHNNMHPYAVCKFIIKI